MFNDTDISLQKEKINSLYINNSDPVIMELCKIIGTYHDMYGELEFVKDEYEFNGSVSDYVRSLQNDISFLTDENYELSGKINDLEHKLKTRTVMELLQESENRYNSSLSMISSLEKDNHKLQKECDKAKEQLNMWAILNR